MSSPSRYWISRCLWPVIGKLSASSISSIPRSRVCQGGNQPVEAILGLGTRSKAALSDASQRQSRSGAIRRAAVAEVVDGDGDRGRPDLGTRDAR